MDYSCQYCDRTFSSKYNMKNHQKTAKFCLEIQNKKNEKGLECEYCGKTFTQQKTYNHHIEQICREKMIVDIADLKERLREKDRCILKYKNRLTVAKQSLQKYKENANNYVPEIERLSKIIKQREGRIAQLNENISFEKGKMVGTLTSQPKKVINNNGNNIIYNVKLSTVSIENVEPFTTETIRKNIEKYTFDLFLKKERGVIEYITDLTTITDKDGVINRSYVCTDESHNSFHRLTNSKEWTFDNGASFLSTVLDELKHKSAIHNSYISQQQKLAHENEEEDLLTELSFQEKNVGNFIEGIQNHNKKARDRTVNTIRDGIKEIVSI